MTFGPFSEQHVRAFIAFVIAVLLAYILLSLAHDVQGETAKCIPTTIDENAQIKRMMGRAFDRAFEQQIASLYKVYVGNAPSVEQQRKFTRTGIDNAVAAWQLATSGVNVWEGCK